MESETIQRRTFGIADYIVFGCLIFVSIIIGVFFAFRDKKHNTSSNFFLGNRKMKALPLALSFVVTFQSSIMMLGTPAEVYAYGLQLMIELIGIAASFLFAALIVVPLIHPLKLTSVYEYYTLRYETDAVRYMCVIFGVCYYTLYMGTVLFGTALALQSTAGLPLWLSIVIFSFASMFYTSIGGIKAVIWTDIFQSVVMLAGILAVIIKSTVSAGGPSNIVSISKDRFNIFNFDPDPTVRHTFWTLALGSLPQFFYGAISQAGVQRILSTPNIQVARRLLYIATPIYCFVLFIVMLEGIAVFAYFSEKGCDPLASGEISNPNQLIPFTILEMFEGFPGMPGLFIAALAAASLSTISSGLSGLSTVTCVDILMVVKPNMKDNVATNISKLFVVLYGLISVAFAFFVFNVKGPLGQIIASLGGAVGGPETGVFLLSAFSRSCRPRAVIFAAVVGLSINLWLVLGQTFSSELKQSPYLPSGPTDQCIVSTSNLSTSNTSHNLRYLNDSTTLVNVSLTLPTSTSAVYFDKSEEYMSGLGTYYSISYMYIHLIGTIVTIVTGLIGSFFTQPKHPYVINEKCVLPMGIFVPPFLKRLFLREKRNRTDRHSNSSESDEMLEMGNQQ